MKKSKMDFPQGLPPPASLGSELILIYDEILPKKSQEFKVWLKKFALTYPVAAGEKLKSIDHFAGHMHQIVKLAEKCSSRKLTLVVVGGGSVGDFGGFVASVLKRGVGLVHIPSTWLAALDSAHGGKTALNVGAAKNQVGSFYPANKVFLVKSLLMAQPTARAFEAFGELLKISWIAGGPLWKRLSRETSVDSEVLWKYLKPAIQSKMAVVAQDPEEKSGHRHILNLGHTVGHVLESYYDIPHGIAINYGLDFALRWSLHKRIIKAADYEQIVNAPIAGFLLSAVRDNLFATKASVLAQFRSQLLSDKKKTTSVRIRFVFPKRPGLCLIQEVSVDDILVEICRQNEEERG